MIVEIRVSGQAHADLRRIFKYIAFELESPENTSTQLDRLEEGIMNLDQMPERFREYETEPWHSCGMRLMLVDNYCVLYILNKEDAAVTIIRVMFGGQNIDVQLERFTKQ